MIAIAIGTPNQASAVSAIRGRRAPPEWPEGVAAAG
jgi:hypothetical protein